MEVIKYLSGIGETLKGRLLIFDGDNMTFETLAVKRIPSCKICSGISS
jgi:adenylyltransferase/sulfurtransferase